MPARSHRLSRFAAATLLAAGAAYAQQPPAPASSRDNLTFEVASIKRNNSLPPGPHWNAPPGRFQMINGPIASLIWTAYDTPLDELPGAPSWVHSDRYDVIATYAGSPGQDAIAAMLRSLLAQRFRLQVHYETQDRPVYALVVARPGRLGPALLPSVLDCTASGAKCGMSLGGGTLRAIAQPLEIIRSVGRPDGRIIVDKTGLTGRYDFTLRYALQPGPNDDTPSLFTALEEQLGLRLMPDTAPLPVVVVDRIERPTED